jgi:hypothetical protein
VELDFVDAVAEAVVRVQLRREGVGQPRMRLHPGGARELAELAQRGRVQPGRVQLERVLQRPVGVEQVVVHQRRRLVGDFVRGRGHVPSMAGRHRPSIAQPPDARRVARRALSCSRSLRRA